MTVFNAYNETKRALKEAGIEPFAFEARQIIRHITGLSNNEIMMRYNSSLSELEESYLQVVLSRRINHEPLQYILGEWSFYGLDFIVGEGVLVPRADTETLVDTAIEFLKDKEDANVLDLCSGSGCIAVAIAKNTATRVDALEKYDAAYDYLIKNIEKNNAQVVPIKDDVFSFTPDKKYDIIVSNPPYVSADEMELLDEETRKEPDTALYGGEDGLLYYRVIAKNYPKHLKAGGMLAFEVGFSEAEAVKQILLESGLQNIGTKEDINGIQRVVFGTVK